MKIKNIYSINKALFQKEVDYSSLDRPDAKGLKNLLQKMLVVEYPPDNRPTVLDLLKDPWLTDNGKDKIMLYKHKFDFLEDSDIEGPDLQFGDVLDMLRTKNSS